jgi:hypothetical protein
MRCSWRDRRSYLCGVISAGRHGVATSTRLMLTLFAQSRPAVGAESCRASRAYEHHERSGRARPAGILAGRRVSVSLSPWPRIRMPGRTRGLGRSFETAERNAMLGPPSAGRIGRFGLASSSM